jgi:hypothetical protein
MVMSTASGSLCPLDPPPERTLIRRVFDVEPVEINAPIERVWAVLTDFAQYPEWNPLNRAVEADGEAKAGTGVVLSVSWGPYEQSGVPVEARSLSVELTNRETISIWEAPWCIAWADSIGALHRAERVQCLVALPGGRTRYHTREVMEGLLSPLIAKIYGERIFTGFRACGDALRRRVESLV